MLSKNAARHLAFVAFTIVALFLFRLPLQALYELSAGDPRYSHAVVMPLVSVVLVYYGRRKFLHGPLPPFGAGVPVLLLGTVLCYLAAARTLVPPDGLWFPVFAWLLVWTAGFAVFYGGRALRASIFALALLLFAIPIPGGLVDGFVVLLQKGSAEAAYVLFNLAGIPVIRDGLRFSLPGLEIEVAEECSGVRSAFAIVITGLLASHALLRTTWARTSLVLLTIPIAIFKNAVRIVAVSGLASYVDESYIHGYLHRRGGPPFSLLALALVILAIFLLRRWELRAARAKAADGLPT
jgi:exosortase